MIALDHVGGIDQLTDFGQIFEEGREFLPVISPGADDEWIFDAPDFLESVQFEQCPFLYSCFVDRLQIAVTFLRSL